jgi:competence protein CoiA
MFFALDQNRERIPVRPGLRGTCACCGHEVIAKCGEIMSWHWSHRANDCDPWYEPESEWHRDWKSLVPPNRQEVVMGPHRADMVTAMGTVVELQNSPISPETIREREQFYNKMVWIFNAEPYIDNIYFYKKHPNMEHFLFRWKHPRLSQCAATMPLYWDFNDGTLFLVKKMHEGQPCRGWGYWYDKDEMKSRLWL